MANDKVFSVRADDETIAKLEQIAETSGMKKAELLPALMSAYEVQEAKGALPGRATEIANVENLLGQIKTAYIASLELNANAEERIRSEFVTRIENNEQAVASLKAKAEAATASADELKDALSTVTSERDAAVTRAEAAEGALAKLQADTEAEKEQMSRFNISLQSQVDTLKAQAEAAAEEVAAAAAIESENLKLTEENKAAIERATKAEAEVANFSEKLKDEQKKAKEDVTELKGRYEEKLDNLREKLANEKEAAVLKERSEQMQKATGELAAWQAKYEALLAKFAEKAEPAKSARKPATKGTQAKKEG